LLLELILQKKIPFIAWLSTTISNKHEMKLTQNTSFLVIFFQTTRNIAKKCNSAKFHAKNKTLVSRDYDNILALQA
jgi:hypothetical protein